MPEVLTTPGASFFGSGGGGIASELFEQLTAAGDQQDVEPARRQLTGVLSPDPSEAPATKAQGP